jgi:glutathione S-transferase
MKRPASEISDGQLGQLDLPMPKKFTYFALKTPVGLPSMFCLEVSGKAYEGTAVQMSNWDELKPKTPNGQLPFAEMPDGTAICESGAIGRTIAGAAGLLGTGKDFMTSEVLFGITSDFNKKAMDIAPSKFTLDKFDAAKKEAYKEGKAAVLEFIETKYEKFVLPSGDRFTESGLSFGEIDLFSKMTCHADGAFPEIAKGKLEKFYQRMSEVPGIKKVLSGKSQFGELSTYLVPVPP